MTYQSSNSAWIEKESFSQLTGNLRTAMQEGCVSPVHVYDELDELLCRTKAMQEVIGELSLCLRHAVNADHAKVGYDRQRWNRALEKAKEYVS